MDVLYCIIRNVELFSLFLDTNFLSHCFLHKAGLSMLRPVPNILEIRVCHEFPMANHWHFIYYTAYQPWLCFQVFLSFFLLMFSSVTRNTPVFVGCNHKNPTITTQSRRWTFTSSHQHLQRESDRVYSLHTLRYKPNARTSFGQISRSLDDARYGNIFLSRPEIFLIQHSVPRVGTQFSNVSCRSKFNIEGNFTLL